MTEATTPYAPQFSIPILPSISLSDQLTIQEVKMRKKDLRDPLPYLRECFALTVCHDCTSRTEYFAPGGMDVNTLFGVV